MRDRLLIAAARLLAERGNEGVTIDAIVVEARVSRGSFYNHFNSRQELLDGLWAAFGSYPFAKLLDEAEAYSRIDERLFVFMHNVLSAARRDPAWGWLVVALSAHQSTVNEDLLRFPARDLHLGAERGDLDVPDIQAGIDLVVGTVRSAITAILSGGRSAAYQRRICAMILLSLGVTRERISVIEVGFSD